MKREQLKQFIATLKENNENNENNSSGNNELKQQASSQLEKASEGGQISVEAGKILEKLAITPQTWSSIYESIEKFRNDTRVRDKFDNTANPTQIGMASVLLVIFQLILESDFLIEPIDTKIIITTFKNNFTHPRHLEALEIIAEELL